MCCFSEIPNFAQVTPIARLVVVKFRLKKIIAAVFGACKTLRQISVPFDLRIGRIGRAAGSWFTVIAFGIRQYVHYFFVVYSSTRGVGAKVCREDEGPGRAAHIVNAWTHFDG